MLNLEQLQQLAGQTSQDAMTAIARAGIFHEKSNIKPVAEAAAVAMVALHQAVDAAYQEALKKAVPA